MSSMASEPSDDELLDGAPCKPRDVGALLRRGIVLQAIGRYTESLDPLLQAIGINFADPNLWLHTMIALTAPGRYPVEQQLKQALAALRELRPQEDELWFTNGADPPLAPFAAYSRAVYQAVFVGPKAWEQAVAQLVTDYGNFSSLRVQSIVGKALLDSARRAHRNGKQAEAERQFDDLIVRYHDSTDSRLQAIVADALVNRGKLMADSHFNKEALTTWDRVVTTYGDEFELRICVAVALWEVAEKYGNLGNTKEQLSRLQEFIRRYADDPEPGLRELAAKAGARKVSILAATGDPRASHDARLEVISRYRYDRNPTVARIALNARLQQWLERRNPMVRSILTPARRFILYMHRLLRRSHDDLAVGQPHSAAIAVGMALSIAAPILIVASIAGYRFALSKEGPDRSTHSGLLLVFWIAAFASQALWLLGRRLRGHFSIGMLRFAPKRLWRTLLWAAVTLWVVWITPTVEEIGKISLIAPPRNTYRFLQHTVHVPEWLDFALLCVIVPVEYVLIFAYFTVVLQWVRNVLGSGNSVGEVLGESVPHVTSGDDEEE